MSKFQEIKFDLKKNLINKLETKDAIINDCLKEISESLIYEYAKDDFAKILRKCRNYKFIIEYDLFDELYGFVVDTTQNHIEKSIEKNSKFINNDMGNIELINKIISRIVNNFKNLFDKRYKNSITVYKNSLLLDNLMHFDDALSILIAEEEAKDELITAKHSNAIREAANKLIVELTNRANELQESYQHYDINKIMCSTKVPQKNSVKQELARFL
ncbi:MAG: hypothetical protein RBT52_01725 [Sulfurimonas sp.]|nr:hypothetical protein [Sulfurimonas sp.]